MNAFEGLPTKRCTGRQFRYAPSPPVSLVVLGRAAPGDHAVGEPKAGQERQTDTIHTARPRMGGLSFAHRPVLSALRASRTQGSS